MKLFPLRIITIDVIAFSTVNSLLCWLLTGSMDSLTYPLCLKLAELITLKGLKFGLDLVAWLNHTGCLFN